MFPSVRALTSIPFLPLSSPIYSLSPRFSSSHRSSRVLVTVSHPRSHRETADYNRTINLLYPSLLLVTPAVSIFGLSRNAPYILIIPPTAFI